MKNLKFYNVDLAYIAYLQEAEEHKRGYSCVPNMEYVERKPKFLCGIVLLVNDQNYFVPVSSYKKQQPDNFLIKADSGKVTSSLRFNYMIPVPEKLLVEKNIRKEPDPAYRRLLAQELSYCIKNQDMIRQLAKRTYNRVLLGKNPGLVKNSCDFLLLEEKCNEYIQIHRDCLDDQINQAKGLRQPAKAKNAESSLVK